MQRQGTCEEGEQVSPELAFDVVSVTPVCVVCDARERSRERS